jgi:alpha-ketoglutarate-dependent taurine dioxygenase
VIGGTSIFSDAVHAASLLYNTNPEAFNVLATTPVAFHYINDGHHLHHSHPTIELAAAPPSSADPPREWSINYVNYSPPFQAPLSLSTTPSAFYPALAQFASLLAKPDLTFEYTLKEGDAVLFDNRRVLHARTAFSDREDENAGHESKSSRWLKGCYLEADALLDRGRVLRTKAERALL